MATSGTADVRDEKGPPTPTAASPPRPRTAPVISPEFENPQGVPISAIVFGGRRAKTAPLVYQSRDWEHGVFVGSIMASETTAAATGAVGVVRRDPMAMLPFCGYHMADYWQHWLDMGEKIWATRPQRSSMSTGSALDDEGNFIWPGFGDNLRVLEWIMKRCFDEVGRGGYRHRLYAPVRRTSTWRAWISTADTLPRAFEGGPGAVAPGEWPASRSSTPSSATSSLRS